ncbi:hypothetical protein, partial [uncultured Vagococcus sp.]|uniref:hypothetical protein n=1 Tax=uncultured Vagococcus sp. TaxID=189676 RepID=UPI0028D6EA46
ACETPISCAVANGFICHLGFILTLILYNPLKTLSIFFLLNNIKTGVLLMADLGLLEELFYIARSVPMGVWWGLNNFGWGTEQCLKAFNSVIYPLCIY